MSSHPTRWIESWGRDRRIYAHQSDMAAKCIHDRGMQDHCQSCADQHFEKVVRETLLAPQYDYRHHTTECSTQNVLRLGRGDLPACTCVRTL